MGALVRWELKKLCHRKVTWIALLLCVALFAQGQSYVVQYFGLNGYARGYRGIYQRYMGQTVTEAFKAQVSKDFNQYLLAHPGSFELEAADPSEPDGQNGKEYVPSRSATGYDSGVWDAFSELKGEVTVELEQEYLQPLKSAWQPARTSTGTPCSLTVCEVIRRKSAWA